MRKYDTDIPVYSILPYNSVFLERLLQTTQWVFTLDECFVTKLWNTEQKLYVWTINSSGII